MKIDFLIKSGLENLTERNIDQEMLTLVRNVITQMQWNIRKAPYVLVDRNSAFEALARIKDKLK